MCESVIDHYQHRQHKMNRIVTWHFDFVVECQTPMLQAAPLLSYVLSNYLYFINKAITIITIGFTSFGLPYLIISAATISYNCLLTLHSLIYFGNKHKKYLRRSREWSGHLFSQKKKWLRSKFSDSYGLDRFGTFDHIELPMANQSNQPHLLFNEETDWDGCVLDSGCIT